jgi:rhodanese-related sulfurtransferase
MPGHTTITPVQLSRLIGTPDAPAILDLRLPEDRAVDPFAIPTARTIAHTDLSPLPEGLQGRRVVCACQRGKKISEGAAALLRTQGVVAETLDGGTLAWAEAGLPRVPLAALPATRRWVTRHRPKIDRIACPWLIRRFVDPAAEFLFVAPAEVAAVADRFDATPFDIDGVFFSHRGEMCTFDTMLAEFGLSTPALDRLALVVRAADTDRHDLAPQAAGLLAISVGLSRLHRDDLSQLDAGIALYDALYRWARDGFEEGHDWPGGRA